MKKIIAVLILALTLLASPALADFIPSISSGEQAASALIYTVPAKGVKCYLSAVEVITDGTNNATLIVYDNTAGSGTVLLEIRVTGTDHYGGRSWTFPVRVDNGIYGAVTGTGASFIIEYILR